MRPPFYHRGARVDIDDTTYQVEAILREGKGIMQALKMRKVEKKMKTKMLLGDDAYVMKRFRNGDQSTVAKRAYLYWERLREVLQPAGFPGIVYCDDEIVLTEYLEGEDVSKLPGLDTKQIARIMADVAEQIDVLLGQDMAHGDVKPANMIRDGVEKTRLIDMDYLAPLGEIRIGESSLAFGTPGFMAPEHKLGRYERGTDMYALGKSAFQLLGSAYGVNMQDWLQRYNIPTLPSSVPDPVQIQLMGRHLFRYLARKDGENESQSRRLVDFIIRSMSFDAVERPKSAKEVRQILFE